MKKYSCYRTWGACVLAFTLLAVVVVGCSGEDDDYPKGDRPPVIESVRKVACIGNSITYGARQFLNDREKECYPALLGWACSEMLLSASSWAKNAQPGGAVSCQAHGGCIHLAYATGQSVGSGILMIRAARRCEARAGKTQTRQKNEKSHPKVALSIL